MKKLLPMLCCVILCLSVSDRIFAAETGYELHKNKECCQNGGDSRCDMPKRGWCGKRKGDLYGARRPVASVEDARVQFTKYFSGQQMTVAEVAEKQWRFEADVLDNCGKVVDRVMIDKRSGRVRSMY